jgi:hypothetical protein
MSSTETNKKYNSLTISTIATSLSLLVVLYNPTTPSHNLRKHGSVTPSS